MAERDLFLGVDVGTTSIKAALYDSGGRLDLPRGRALSDRTPGARHRGTEPRGLDRRRSLPRSTRFYQAIAPTASPRSASAAKRTPMSSSTPQARPWRQPSCGRTIAPRRRPLGSMPAFQPKTRLHGGGAPADRGEPCPRSHGLDGAGKAGPLRQNPPCHDSEGLLSPGAGRRRNRRPDVEFLRGRSRPRLCRAPDRASGRRERTTGAASCLHRHRGRDPARIEQPARAGRRRYDGRLERPVRRRRP